MPADQDHARLAREGVEPPQDDRKRMLKGARDHDALLALLVGRARVDEQGAVLRGGLRLPGVSRVSRTGFPEQGVDAAGSSRGGCSPTAQVAHQLGDEGRAGGRPRNFLPR